MNCIFNSTTNLRKSFSRFFLVACLIAGSFSAFAQPVTFSTGSYIIDLGAGVTSGVQNKDKGLRPYGMVYDMLKNYNVPIYVYINPSKVKDGTDLIYNGHSFRGGVFIIEKTLVSAAAQVELNKWFGGVLTGGKGLVTKFDVVAGQPLTLTPNVIFKAAPTWTLDLQNGDIAKGFFANAGIPITAYNEILPSQLGACNDVFVMPHADPTWLTHSNLLNWNNVYKGAIWAGCHAVSALEGMYNPANISQQTNFLSTKLTTNPTSNPNIILPVNGSTAYAQNSLILWGNHSDGLIPPPYLTNTGTVVSGQVATPSDPVSQFMGVSDAAHQNGSEQIFFPVKGGGWLPSTKIITWDNAVSTADVPGTGLGKSNGPGVIIAYGRAFGDNNRGLVQYQAGHSINKGTIGDVAAQRAFFNFSFLAMQDKIPTISSIAGLPPGNIFETFPAPKNYNLSVTFSSPIGASLQSVTWTALRTDNGASAGNFVPNGTNLSGNTVFTPFQVFGGDVPIVITAKVVDVCGRTTFESVPVTLKPSPRPPVANPATKTLSGSCFGSGDIVTFDLATVTSDPDGSPMTYSLGTTGLVPGVGTWSIAGSVVTFTPVANFFGSATNTYTVCDNTSTLGYPAPDNVNLCANSTINFTLGNADANGCFPGSVYGLSSVVGASAATVGAASVLTPLEARFQSDYDDETTATATASCAVLDNSAGRLVLDYGSVITSSARDTIHLYYSRVNANAVNLTLEYSTDGIAYSPLGSTFAATGTAYELQEVYFDFPAQLRYIRIGRTGGNGDEILVDAIELEDWGCVSSLGQVVNDAFTVREDTPIDLDVLANDINPLNKSVKVTIVSAPTQGVAVVNSDNTIRYQPTKDNENNDVFTYQACTTDDGACLTGTVTITKKADACDPGKYAPLDGTESSFTLFPTKDGWYKEDSNGDDIQAQGNNKPLEVGKKLTKRKRAVLQFSTVVGGGANQLPSGATITSATLRLVRTGGDGETLNLGTYKVIQGPGNIDQDWTEGQVTWKHRNKGTTTLWSTVGGTINTTPYSTLNSDGTNGNRIFDMKNMATEWYATPATNFGVVIGQTGNVDKRHQFGAREYTSDANKPMLTINYRTEAPCENIPNYGPLARPDNQSTTSGVAITFDPRTNDTDYENNPITITGVSGNPSGSVVSNTTTTITYTPAPGSVVPRVEKLLYTISDGQGNTHQNWVYITITNHAPLLKNDNPAAVLSGTNVVVNVHNDNGNGVDSDPESQSLGNAVVTVNPLHGDFSVVGTTITYTPFTFNTPGVESFVGLDSLTYQRCETLGGNACDPVFLCSTAKVYFTINNRPPVTTPRTVNTGSCVPVNFDLTTSYADPENQALTFTVTNALSESPTGTWNYTNGTLKLNNDGTFTFTPAVGFPAIPGTQNVVINYTVTDTYGVPTNGVLTVAVTNPATNGAPVANPDNPTTNPSETIGLINTNMYIGVLANDTDPENHTLALHIPGGVGLNEKKNVFDDNSTLAGTIEISGNNILYIPAYNYVSTGHVLTFQYQVCDVPPGLNVGCAPLTPACSTGDVTLQINNTTLNTPVDISGTVWYDVNNSANGTLSNIYSAGENGTSAGNTLYAYIINTATNMVTAKVQVSPTGQYLLPADKNTNVTVFVSATDITVGTVILPANLAANITLPTGWVATSPLSNSFAVAELGFNDKDFGVEERPIAGSGSNNAVNPGGTIQVAVPANTFTNTLVSSDPAPGTVTGIRITAFPTGATSIVVNGTQYNAAVPAEVAALLALIIPTDANGNPTVTITVDPSAEEAPNSVTIPFKSIDNGNIESLNTGTAVLNFTCAGGCITYRTKKDGHWSDVTVWEVQKCNGDWIAAINTPVQGNQVLIFHVVKQDVDFTVQNCPLILQNNGTSKLIIEPNKTLGFAGGADGNAYFNNRPVVVRSTINGTGAIGEMLSNSKTNDDENVTLERFLPDPKRRWNLLTVGVTNGTTVNTTTTLRDAWAGGDQTRVSSSNNISGTERHPLGNPWLKPKNMPWPLYASDTALLIHDPYNSGYNPANYTPYTGTIITGHRYADAATANPKGFDWWPELIIPKDSTFWQDPSTPSVAHNLRTTPSSIRPYRPDGTTDFGPERGADWISNGEINSVPGKGGRSIVQLKLNELDPGYMLFTRGDRRVLENWYDSTTLRPTGKIWSGDLSMPVNAKATQALTVVPNFYPAPISLEKLYSGVSNSNVMEAKAHVWDSKLAGPNGFGGWVTLTRIATNDWVAAPSVAAAHPDFISSSQAFMVEGTASGGTLNFRENMKVDIKTLEFTPFDNEPSAGGTGVLLTNLNNRSTNGTLSIIDGVGILLDNKFTPAVTDDNDVRKVFNFEGGKSLAILRDGNLLSFDAYSEPGAETVFPLQANELAKAKYALTFTPRNLDKDGREAWLKDNFLGIESPISLTSPTQYNFEGTADGNSLSPTRFEIVFKQGEILPVTFTSVNAVQQGKNVKVTWNVATEVNMSHYEVEHSTNGTEFGKAVKVDAKNTSPASYDWLHVQPGAGDHFYRVRAFNLEGRSLLTKVVKVTLGDNQPGFKAFPTVVSATRQVTLQLISLDKGVYTLQVTDMAGRVISARTIEHNGGSASMVMQMPPSLSAGKYNIRLTGTGGSFVEPLVKD